MSDRHYLGQWALRKLRGRNVILYGNADTNAAFGIVASPLQARRGRITFDGHTWIGPDLAACLVHPHAEDDEALVGVFADSGIEGARLGYTLMPFVSGAGYPDYAIFDATVLTKGDAGVLAAGFFDGRWRVQAGGYVRPDAPWNGK